MMAKGRFITLEGVDGAGKSTHAAWLVDAIAARGHRSSPPENREGPRWGKRCAAGCWRIR